MNPYESPLVSDSLVLVRTSAQKSVQWVGYLSLAFWGVMFVSGVTEFIYLRNQAANLRQLWQTIDENFVFDNYEYLYRWYEYPGALPIAIVSLTMCGAEFFLIRSGGRGSWALVIAYGLAVLVHWVAATHYWINIFAGFLPPESPILGESFRANVYFATIMTWLLYAVGTAHLALMFYLREPATEPFPALPILKSRPVEPPRQYLFAVIFLVIVAVLALLKMK